MKTKFLLFSLFLGLMLFSSCQESMPSIDCLSCPPIDPPPPPPEERRILIEEFSGVRCVGCPQGSAEIQNLLSIYGERVIPVAIHTTNFANPYSNSAHNFRTPEGDDLLGYLGLPDGLPSAVINRTEFANQTSLQLAPPTIWAAYVGDQVDQEAKVRLGLSLDWNPTDRSLSAKVEIDGTISIEEEVRLTVLITESEIVDPQLTGTGIQDDYVHRHVLRGHFTNFDGQVIAEELPEGTSIAENYTYTLPELWKAENCSVVAFVHLDGATKEVLQATEAHLPE